MTESANPMHNGATNPAHIIEFRNNSIIKWPVANTHSDCLCPPQRQARDSLWHMDSYCSLKTWQVLLWKNRLHLLIKWTVNLSTESEVNAAGQSQMWQILSVHTTLTQHKCANKNWVACIHYSWEHIWYVGDCFGMEHIQLIYDEGKSIVRKYWSAL